MSIGILGRKIGMSQVFDEGGKVTPVTLIEAGPCRVVQIKELAKEGYSALRIGFGERNPQKVKKSQLGTFKKVGLTPLRYLREFRVSSDELSQYVEGAEIKTDIFSIGDFVDVTGTSIGKGFQGGMKRWHWSGGPATHGSMEHRRVGSIGASADPSRVLKGTHMPGHMGNKRATIESLKVVRIDKEKNQLLLKGAVPGPKGGLLIIKRAKKKAVSPKSESKSNNKDS